MTPSSLTTICALCWTTFEARTSYGLCPSCWSRDRLREFDRLQSAMHKAEHAHLPVTLTLIQWLGTTSDFKGLCAYCLEVPYSFIETVDPLAGLTWENVVPICRACAVHTHHSFNEAEGRVHAYLAGERQPQLEQMEVAYEL